MTRKAKAIAAASAVVVIALAWSLSAFALQTHSFSSSFSGSGTNALGQPTDTALDNSSGGSAGDVYVNDLANFRIEKFDSAGTFILMFGKGVDQTTGGDVCTAASGDTCQAGTQGSAAGQFSAPTFLAVDGSSGASAGDVYVGDTGDNLVSKYDSGGNLITSWGSGGQLDGSTATDGPFGSIAGIAVDASGTLMVLNTGSRLFEFAQDGSFNTDFGVARGTAAGGLAVDGNGNFFKVNGDGSVQKFTSSDTNLGQVTSAHGTTGLAADPANNELYQDVGSQVNHYAFNGSGQVITGGSTCSFGSFFGCPPTDSFDTQLNSARGLAVNGSNHDLFIADTGNTRVDLYTPLTLADATTNPATNVTSNSATLNGHLDPAGGGDITDCHFSYVDDADFNPSAPDPYAAGATQPCAQQAPISAATDVSADVGGLQSATLYHFRVVAVDAGGTNVGADQTFTTTHTPIPPSIDATSVANVSSSSAQLRAQINPNFFDSTYHFEVVDDAGFQASGFTNATKLPQPDVDIGAGGSDVAVSQPIQGLSPNTVYHYRAVAANTNGPADGPARTFATFPLGAPFHLPDNRAYEQVSPTDKNGADAALFVQGRVLDQTRSSADGNGFVFSSFGTAFANEASNMFENFYLSRRGSTGWTTQGINPPQDSPAGNGALALAEEPFGSLAFTDNLDTGVAFQFFNPPLTPDAAPNQANLYRVGLANPASPSYQVITPAYPHTSPGCLGGGGGGCVFPNMFGASSDLSHVVFWAGDNLTPDAPSGGVPNDYEWVNGQLSLVNIAPDGTPIASGAANSFPGPGIVSPDGSRVFFSGGDGNLYVRENGAATVQIDAAQGAGPGGGGSFEGASADGSHVVFADDASAGLTADTVPGSGQNLYLYDVDTGTLTDLSAAATANLDGATAVSGDGSYVYFVAEGVLAGGAQANQPNLYLSHNGQTTFIATLTPSFPSDVTDWYRPGFGGGQGTAHGPVALSPDGTRLAFQSINPLTGFDNTSANGSTCGADQNGNGFGPQCPEVFLYDAGTGQLHCASCNPTGAQPLGPGTLPMETPFDQSGLHRATAFSSDGSRLFFQSGDALVGGDTNGRQDVYEYENGQLHLISNGVSPDPSFFLDASPSGNDAFFETKAQLVGQDQDNLYDVYDARVGGGIPQQQLPPPCLGDACRQQTSPPGAVTPGSATNSGPGNQGRSPNAPATTKKKCRKGRKGRKCRKHNRRANANRGASK